MYAIIRAGGKQAKVREGDVIDVERIKAEADEVTFTPLLLVAEDGTVTSDRKALEKVKVTAKILGESQGDKIDIFKYKNKTGYRRRQGHRQKYTRIEVTKISGAAKKKSATKKKTEDKEAEPTKEAKPTAKAKSTEEEA